MKVEIHKSESKIIQQVGNTIAVKVRSRQTNSKRDIKRQQIKVIPEPKNKVEKDIRQQVATRSEHIQTISIKIKQKIIL